MAKLHRPRHGSLQFWPRKRAAKELPSVNWKPFEQRKIESKNKLLGFVGYKAGMISLLAKDSTNNSMTKGKNIVLPATIIECPPMKILSIRFYKGSNVALDVLAPSLDAELRRRLRMPKKSPDLANAERRLGEFTDVRAIAYTVAKKGGIKKAPDVAEIGLSGSVKDKFEFLKGALGKEIGIEDVFQSGQMLDVHGVTKGKGFTGPVKRYGLTLKSHKSEKGVRRPGSLAPWHPARCTYMSPLAGQMGYFTRVQYNNKIILMGKEFDKIKGASQKSFIDHYGNISNPFCIMKGSISGPQKRAVMLTLSFRPTAKTAKQNLEVLEIL